MSATIKLFIFFVLIIKIVNCGICSSRPQVYEGNNYGGNNHVVNNNEDNDIGFQGFNEAEVQEFAFNLVINLKSLLSI
uniref:Uncharacterized protein n=1 Tax=Meloidogyne floridensis TaxID=298350 RepID=A0A915NR29_9BILA